MKFISESPNLIFSPQETRAIPKRLSSLTDDVERQTSREGELQKRYSDMKHELEQLQPQPY